MGVDAQLYIHRLSWENSFGGDVEDFDSTKGSLQIGFSAFVL